MEGRTSLKQGSSNVHWYSLEDRGREEQVGDLRWEGRLEEPDAAVNVSIRVLN